MSEKEQDRFPRDEYLRRIIRTASACVHRGAIVPASLITERVVREMFVGEMYEMDVLLTQEKTATI